MEIRVKVEVGGGCTVKDPNTPLKIDFFGYFKAVNIYEQVDDGLGERFSM